MLTARIVDYHVPISHEKHDVETPVIGVFAFCPYSFQLWAFCSLAGLEQTKPMLVFLGQSRPVKTVEAPDPGPTRLDVDRIDIFDSRDIWGPICEGRLGDSARDR